MGLTLLFKKLFKGDPTIEERSYTNGWWWGRYGAGERPYSTDYDAKHWDRGFDDGQRTAELADLEMSHEEFDALWEEGTPAMTAQLVLKRAGHRHPEDILSALGREGFVVHPYWAMWIPPYQEDNEPLDWGEDG